MVGEHPVREDALIYLAHLPRPGDHAAPVDHRAEPVGVAVLLDQELRRELGRPIEGAGAVERKILGDAGRRDSGERLFGAELEARLGLLERHGAKLRHRVDPARRQEHDVDLMAAGELEAVVGPQEVRSHKVIGAAIKPGERGWLRRALQQRVGRAGAQQIVEEADIPVLKRHPGAAQPRQVQLRTPAVEVVEGGDFPVGMARGEPDRHVGADESGTAGYEHAHIARRLCLPGAIGGLPVAAPACSLDCTAVRSLPTRLEGPILIEPSVHGDARGFFLESYRRDRLRELGIGDDFVQDNHSRSRKGVVRGMHYQRGMAKLIRCARGAILDVLVDLRRESPTFGHWEGFELSDEAHRALYCPDGFAHGFCVLSDIADVLYKTSTYYAPELEGGFAFNDPEVAIAWPQDLKLVASARDSQAPKLSEIAEQLPF